MPSHTKAERKLRKKSQSSHRSGHAAPKRRMGTKKK